MRKKIPSAPFTEQERSFQADYQWARHDAMVLEKYRGHIIAVRDQKVIAAARSLAELQSLLEKQHGLSAERPVIVPIGM